jgi:hypothetical protein
MYQVYALAGPLESITWSDMFYIGASRRIEYRYSQHIACSDSCQEEKNELVRSILAQGKMPSLWLLQGEIEDAKEARAREQYFIRYAISQGANLLNKQITYTDKERQKSSENRALRYAEITEVLRSGTYVKWCGGTYAGRLLSTYDGPIGLCNQQDYFFVTESGKRVSIREASDQEFDNFIHLYISVDDYGIDGWDGEDRYQAVNFSMAHGKLVDLVYDPQPKQRKPVRR